MFNIQIVTDNGCMNMQMLIQLSSISVQDMQDRNFDILFCVLTAI